MDALLQLSPDVELPHNNSLDKTLGRAGFSQLFTSLEVTGLNVSWHKWWEDVGQKMSAVELKKKSLCFWICSMDVTEECL